MSDTSIEWLRRYASLYAGSGEAFQKLSELADELESSRSLVSSYEQRLEAARKAWDELADSIYYSYERAVARQAMFEALFGLAVPTAGGDSSHAQELDEAQNHA
jgi:hypothetical protein